MRIIIILGFVASVITGQLAADCGCTIKPLTNPYKWSVLGYFGLPTKTTLGQILKGKYKTTGAKLYAAELGYRLDDDNPIRRLFGRLISQFELASNVAYINGGGNAYPVWEIDPMIMVRWNKFPWNRHLATSFAVGEGISYATRIPIEEAQDASEQGDPTKHLINFLILEATAALPEHPQWQLVTRIHHRSGAFGTYGAGNSGSNALSVGVRYTFS